jgi:hypothetical protein
VIPPVRLRTSLEREEAWELDDLAHQVGVRRSHIMRAMLRYALQDKEKFLAWLSAREDHPVETPGDPTPIPLEEERS